MSITYTKQDFQNAIEESQSMAQAAAKLNLHFSTFKRNAKKFGLYEPNPGLKGYNKPKEEGKGKLHLQEILAGKHPQYQSYKLKNRLLKENVIDYKCVSCGISEYNNKPISLELDHIDGNSNNHQLSNLRLLCPNCHSQTETFRFKRGKK